VDRVLEEVVGISRGRLEAFAVEEPAFTAEAVPFGQAGGGDDRE
jgi:hypothetical protein